jgi:hypothetical protein
VSIDLVVEVLDHYHGPHSRKVWLLAWAEKVPKGSRTGYCKREVLVARLGRSPSRVSGIARELEDEGTIKRLGGGVWGKAAVYELLPLATAQGQPRADPTQGQPRADPTQGQPRADPTAEPGPRSQGQPRAHAQGQPRADPNPHNPHKPSSTRRTTRTGSRGEPAATDDDDDSSQPLTAIDARTLLLGLDAHEDEIPPIINLIAEATGRDPGQYLSEQIGGHGENRGRQIVRRARRKLGLPEPKPPWCRDPECDERTRLRVIDTEDGPKARKCPKCHPDRAGGRL